MQNTDEAPRKRSFWTWLAIVYFVSGLAALVLMATQDTEFASVVGVFWAVIFIGLGLVSLGSDNLDTKWGKGVRAIGWIWLALILAMISMTRNAALVG